MSEYLVHGSTYVVIDFRWYDPIGALDASQVNRRVAYPLGSPFPIENLMLGLLPANSMPLRCQYSPPVFYSAKAPIDIVPE
jgi:hypothetical protein